MHRWVVVAAAALGIAFAGCGSSKTDTTTAVKPILTAPPSQAQLARRPGLTDVKRRLRRAGLFPAEVDLGAKEQDALEVRHVDVIQFPDGKTTKAYTGFLKMFFRAHPTGVISRQFGHRLYWTGDEQPLTAAQLRNFRHIVAVGQGSGS